MVKKPPAKAGDKMWVQSLCGEDPMEEDMASHSSILAWQIPWTEEPAGYSPQGHRELDISEATYHARTCALLISSLFSLLGTYT